MHFQHISSLPPGPPFIKGVFADQQQQLVRLHLYQDQLILYHQDDPSPYSFPLSFFITFYHFTQHGKDYLVFASQYPPSSRKFAALPQQKELIIMWTKQLRGLIARRGMSNYYKFVKNIGKGGTGVVNQYVRVDGKRFAVKQVLLSGLNPIVIEAIAHQVKVLRLLNHPNIMKLVEIYIEDGTIKIVNELLEGNLSNWIKQRSLVRQNQIRAILVDLIAALQHMHSKRLVHRDLKFDNVLVRNKKGVCSFVLADMGLCAWIDQENQYFSRCGTYGYIAPQIFQKKQIQITPKIDIFSLGCMVHTLLIGSAPFASKNLPTIAQKNKQCDLNFASIKYSHLSMAEISFLRGMLQKDPAKRYSLQQIKQHFFMMAKTDRPIFSSQKKQKVEQSSQLGRTKSHEKIVRQERAKLCSKSLAKIRGGRINGDGIVGSLKNFLFG